MSYGHAETPLWYTRPDAHKALAVRDIGAVYRLLNQDGVSQREIARRTGQVQSEVSEILKGRRVLAYDLLVRIAEGLGVPRELLGLSHGAYGGEVTVAEPPKVSAEMLRRHLIALGGVAMVGAPVTKLGELFELPAPSPVPLPSQLSYVHVAKVRDLTRRLDEVAIMSGSEPEVSTAAAGWAMRLLDVSGASPVKRALMVAVAQLQIQAGWAGFDAGLYDRAVFHYARGLELATKTGNAYCKVLALNYAGLATVEHGHPNDGLKILQVGQVTSRDIPPDHDQGTVVIGEGSRAALEACARTDAATALARLGHSEAAYAELATARELWQPTRTDSGGDLDRPVACLELERGRLDAAEQFAAASVRRWEGISQVGHTQSAIVLATVHVRAGEPRGLQLAHDAITAATRLHSTRARRRLEPLVAALQARHGAEAHELARQARQVAVTRA